MAEVQLTEVLRRNLTGLLRSIAEQGLATVLLATDRPAEALMSYKRSALIDPSRPGPILGWIHSAVRCEDDQEALLAAALAMEVNPQELDRMLSEHVAIWKDAREDGRFRASPGAVRCAARLVDRLPSSCRATVSVFFETEE